MLYVSISVGVKCFNSAFFKNSLNILPFISGGQTFMVNVFCIPTCTVSFPAGVWIRMAGGGICILTESFSFPSRHWAGCSVRSMCPCFGNPVFFHMSFSAHTSTAGWSLCFQKNGLCMPNVRLHIPPARFVRIRHYGLLSSTSKKSVIPLIRAQLLATRICFIDMRKIKPYDRKICPCCGNASMITLEILPARGPPKPATGQKPSKTKSETVNV